MQIFLYGETVHKRPLIDRVYGLKAQNDDAVTMEEVDAIQW